MIAPAIIPDLAVPTGQPVNSNLKTSPRPGGFLSALQAKTIGNQEAAGLKFSTVPAEKGDLDGGAAGILSPLSLAIWAIPTLQADGGDTQPTVGVGSQMPDEEQMNAMMALSGGNGQEQPAMAAASLPAATAVVPEGSPIIWPEGANQENLTPTIALSSDSKPPSTFTVDDTKESQGVALPPASAETPEVTVLAERGVPIETQPKDDLSGTSAKDTVPPVMLTVDQRTYRDKSVVQEQAANARPVHQSVSAAGEMTADQQDEATVVMAGTMKNHKENPVAPANQTTSSADNNPDELLTADRETRPMPEPLPLNILKKVSGGEEQPAVSFRPAAVEDADVGERPAVQVQPEQGKNLTDAQLAGPEQIEKPDAKPDHSMLFKLQQAMHHTQLLPQETEVKEPESVKHVLQRLEVMVRDNLSQATMILKPEHLGRLTVRMEVQDGVLNAKFVVENQQAREILETNLAAFRHQLEQSGVRVEKVEITLNQPGNDASQFLNQHQYRQPGQDGYQKAESYGTWQPEDQGSSAYLSPAEESAAMMTDGTWLSPQGVNYVI